MKSTALKSLIGIGTILGVVLLANAKGAELSEQDLQTAAALRDQALAGNIAWSLAESLTTEVGPRMAGGENDARGVAWAVAKLKSLEFDRVWTEPVTFTRWIRGVETARIILPFPQELKILTLGGSSATPEDGLSGEVVHFETYQALADAPADAVQGKIVFISNRMKRTRDGSGYGPANIARSLGAKTASEKGAMAILIRSIGTDNNRTPHTGMMRVTATDRVVPAAALSNPDADILENEIKRGGPVTVHLNIGAHWGGEYTSHNVIAEITGSEHADQYVVIGGHLDSWDAGTGAIDDAAGIAVTTAAAKLIADLPQRPRRSIRIILFANEEQGLYGAKQYAENHPEIKNMVAAESDFGAGRVYRLDSKVLDDAYGVVAQMAEVMSPLGIELAENGNGSGSDISAFAAKGTAIVQLSQDGTNYFDYHHTDNDTLDKIDRDDLTQNVAAWVIFTYLAAQTDVAFGPVQPPQPAE